MATPQAGIFREGSAHHLFLEYALDPTASEGDVVEAVGKLCAVTQDGADPSTVLAFGAAPWHRLAPDQPPEGLRPFEAVGGDGVGMPATQRDVLVWLQGEGRDANLDRALALHGMLAGVAGLALDVTGFRYHDSRDLTGFVDGTANPKGADAVAAAVVPADRPGAGGAFVLSQRWVHDLDAFRALPVGEQERVIGRTKADSIELEGDAMPPDAHVARTDVSGVKILRRSAPYGSVAEHGLYFLAFACELARFDVLLARMTGTSQDGVRDRLMDFSRPVTGAYWFAPSQEALRAISG